MILQSKEVKRLIIYFIFDKQGIVDDYITYMLKDLKNNATEIAVVCNGMLTPESRKKLEEVTPIIMVRENKGLDVWAYKSVLDYYGWEKLCKYDEVIMMNYTIMGPIYPLKEMFEKMDAKDLDFWGITKYHEYKEGDPFGTIVYGYIPEHIQSHFIAVRSRMLRSIEFQEYWNNMQQINDYREAVGCHEAIFTRKFSEAGFLWDVYADMGEGYNNHPILCATRQMLEEKRCPIFKRRSFFQDYTNIINDTMGESAYEAYEYIDKYTDYDVNMIWDNILRLENQADIKKNMQLNYVIDERNGKDISEILGKRKIALVLHFYFTELADYCLHYMKSLPKEADIYVTVGDEQKKKIIEETFSELPNKVEVILIENRGRDVSALLVGTKKFIMDYDYVCFVHDKKVVQLKPETIGAGFSYKCFENLLPTKEFVENVLDTFERNPRIGLLTPPPPCHGDYYITLGMEWGLNYKVTKKLAEKLNLTVPISREKEPIAPLGTMFWFRPQAMKLLFEKDWEYKDFPPEPNKVDGTLLHAIERIYSYVVQQEGYYPGWIFSSHGAAMEITNLNYMLRGLNTSIFKAGPGAGKYEEVARNMQKTFIEWRMCRSALGYTEGSIIQAKLYLKTDAGYSEEHTVSVENETDENIYAYKGLEKFGSVSEIRWDPGEKSGIIIKALDVKVTMFNEKVLEFSSKDAITNGMMLKDEMIFLGPDPQLYFKLPEKIPVKNIVIETDVIDHITADRAEELYKKLRGKNILRRIKNKLLR